jgi:hypothetical protein
MLLELAATTRPVSALNLTSPPLFRFDVQLALWNPEVTDSSHSELGSRERIELKH